MIRTATTRKLHRILGVIIGAQLLIWTISGAVFAWNDIETVRGDDHRIPPEPIALEGEWIAPTGLALSGSVDPGRITNIDLVRIGPEVYYRLADADGRIALADVTTGAARGALTADEATVLARASYAAEVPVASTVLIGESDVGPRHEYRGGALPAWVVQFDHPSLTRVYVTQNGGQVTTHRNRTWRVFDFFWMLHTMDYRGRDDFNHALIRFVALAAIALGLSGYLLFSRTSGLLRRRR